MAQFPNAQEGLCLAWSSPNILSMTSYAKDADNIDWEALFCDETPNHICDSIADMETKIFGEFKLWLALKVEIFKYWHLKFILSRATRERESFGEWLNLTIITFKEDFEQILVHMKDIMQLSEPPFLWANKDCKGDNTSMANEDEVDSTRNI